MTKGVLKLNVYDAWLARTLFESYNDRSLIYSAVIFIEAIPVDTT